VPDWYYLLRAARYLGVAPWELIQQEMAWFNLALQCEAAENHAESKRMEKRQRKAKRGT
jgi:hypothetical protein